MQSVGASAEFGNVQGAVVDVITRQGSDVFHLRVVVLSASPSSLTSQPVRAGVRRARPRARRLRTARYRDFTTSLGGPALRSRLWFFGGYQYLRDYDSQPGTDPERPRTYEQDKVFAKLTWRLDTILAAPSELSRGILAESRAALLSHAPFEATVRMRATVPAITFGHLTHTLAANTVWDMRVSRFVF